MGKTYQEDNCIERRHFTKTVSAGQYQLHHTTHLGWGYVYIVQQLDQSSLAVMPPPPPSLYVTDRKPQLVSSPMSLTSLCAPVHQCADCGPILIEYPRPCSRVHCDRAYTFGPEYESFLQQLRHPWLLQDAHDPYDDLAATMGVHLAETVVRSAGMTLISEALLCGRRRVLLGNLFRFLGLLCSRLASS